MLDTQKHFETPEGVELALAPAGPVVRAMAWLVDGAIRVGLYAVASLLCLPLGGLGKGLSLLVFFALEWLYPVFYEVRTGVTPGKRAFGLCVVRVDGTPVSLGGSLLRNLLRVADFLPFGYFFGVLSLLCTERFQRLGDLAAATLVVHTRKAHVAVVPLPGGPSEPVPFPLSVGEQRAIVAFGERAPLWGTARAEELAALSAAWTSAEAPSQQVQRLQRMARWIAGQR